jgi:hypothetical protein
MGRSSMATTRDYAKETMEELEIFNRSRRKKREAVKRHVAPTIRQQYRELMKSYEENKEWQR